MRIGVTPFFNKNKAMLLRKICNSKVIFPDKDRYPLGLSDDFKDIIRKLLDKDINKRLGSKNGVHEILSHPWFKDVDIKGIENQSVEPPLKPEPQDNNAMDFKYFNHK